MKKPNPPEKFNGPGDELNHLSDVIRYYVDNDILTSPELNDSMIKYEELLNISGIDDGSIVLQEHWSFFHELKHNYRQAIIHRKLQIEYVERAFVLGGQIGSINYTYLIDAMRSLYSNYIHVDDFDNANKLQLRLNGVLSRDKTY